MKKLFLLAAFSVLFISTSITAQQKRTITLNEAIQLALENNYQLKQAENNLDLAEYRILSEKADFLPSLNASLNGSRNTGNQFNNNTGNFVNETIYGVGGGLNTSLVIFSGFENINSLRASEQDKISSEESLRRAKETVIFNTASSYLQVLLDQQLLEISRSNLETSRNLLEQIKAQVEVGSRPSVDQYNQEAQVANDELQVTNSENALSLSKLRLVRQLQIDPLLEYEFQLPNFDTEDFGDENYMLADLVDQALITRSDIRSEQANIKSLKLREKIAKSALMPSLSLNGGLNSSANDNTDEPVIIGFENDGTPIFERDNEGNVVTTPVSFNDQFFDRNIRTSLTLNLSVPIFNKLNRSLGIQQAEVQYKNAQLSLENTELQVIQEVTQANNDYSSVIKQLEASEKSLIASRKAFETQQERYNVGASTLIELSQAQTNFVQAQSNRTQALYNLIFQEKLLDYYVGKLSGDDVEF
ncbi:MAG: TolC family protein [Balneola sp.]|nr:TolC family protein [Balneola sp.]MBO6650363.1 TolC family protein [Balneola sp.]MBO6710240.1 TolC family protein [Balneola sp.]MBO6798925.1 TolC family protein [Balneola sp.]MBO6870039.1 TolC family protein [Balneola sp.]